MKRPGFIQKFFRKLHDFFTDCSFFAGFFSVHNSALQQKIRTAVAARIQSYGFVESIIV